MLRYTSEAPGPSLVLLLRHDDSKRAFAYDKGAELVLDLAEDKGWYTVSMHDDFRTVYSYQLTDRDTDIDPVQ